MAGESSKVVPEAIIEAVKRTSINIKTFESNFTEFLTIICNEQVDVLSELDPIQRAQALLYLAKSTTTLFTSLCGDNNEQVDVLSELDPIQRTQALLYLAKSTTTLFTYICGDNNEQVDVFSELDPIQRAQALLYLAKSTSTLFTLRLRCSGVNPDEHPVKTELERLSLYQDKLQRFLDKNNEPLRPSTTLNYQAATRFIEHSLPGLTPEQRKRMKNISKAEGQKLKYTERNVHKKRKYQSSDKQSVRSAAQEFLEKAARELLGNNNNNGIKGPLQVPDEDVINID